MYTKEDLWYSEENFRKLYEALDYIVRALDEAAIIKRNSIFMEMPVKALSKARGE